MNKIQKEALYEKLLNRLYLELPTTVKWGFVDAVEALHVKRGKAYSVYPSANIKERELALNTRPIRMPKRSYNWKSRNRVRDLLLESVEKMKTKESFDFLATVIKGWLLNASKDYLLCDQSDSSSLRRNDSRREIVMQSIFDMVRWYDMQLH